MWLCSELRYISSDAFLHLEHGDKELADIAYNHCETVRQVCFMALAFLAPCQDLDGLATYSRTDLACAQTPALGKPVLMILTDWLVC